MHKQQPIQELEILFQSQVQNVTTSHTAAGASSATANGIGVNTYDGTTGVATVGSITGTQSGSGSFSFAQSFTKGDIAGTASEYTDFGSVTVTSAGTQNGSANAPVLLLLLMQSHLQVLVTLDQPQQVSL